MSQHDYNIANGGGAAVRADLNNALLAILSQNSGATAPTTTKPFMFWYDTATGVLKQRNAADTAWGVVPFSFDASGNVSIASGNVGIGVTPSAWAGGQVALQVKNASLSGYLNSAYVMANTHYDGTNEKYIASSFASKYAQGSGGHYLYTAPSGTAGNAISFTQAFALEHNKTLALQGASPVAGTGITFPATQSASSDANTLDDYEEGSFTPVLNRDGASPTVTYVVQVGKYTKIGNMVTVTIAIRTSAVSVAGSGNTTITGLPFANGSESYTGQGSIGFNSAGVNTLSGLFLSGTVIYFRSGTRGDGNDSGGWGAGYLNISVTYLA